MVGNLDCNDFFIVISFTQLAFKPERWHPVSLKEELEAEYVPLALLKLIENQ